MVVDYDGSHRDGGSECEQVRRCRLRDRLLCSGSSRARHRDGGSAGLVTAALVATGTSVATGTGVAQGGDSAGF